MKFEELKLKPGLLESIKELGFTAPTSIQEKCIPQIMAGKDIIGQSLTGSGKTAAFGIPLINNLIPGKKSQMLVLTPTRELAQQVKEHLDALGKHLHIRAASVYGGVGFEAQIRAVSHSEIIVATPGRLLDHIERRNISLNEVKYMVLDEADRMFDMGFERDVDDILRKTPKDRQTILFSATMPEAAKHISAKYLKTPVHIKDQLQVNTSLLRQVAYLVPREKKFSLLMHLLKKANGTALVFCGKKYEVDKMVRNIHKQGLEAMGVHGDITQNKRQYAVNMFKEGAIDVLVATDVAARGLDIKQVSHVYNYDVPKDVDTYTHRIGRTARAGASGEAVTLVSEMDFKLYNQISRHTDIKEAELPTFDQIVLIKEERFHDGGRGGFRDGGFRSGGRTGGSRHGRRDSGDGFGGRSFSGGGRGGFSGGSRDGGRRAFGEKRFGRRNEYSGPAQEYDFINEHPRKSFAPSADKGIGTGPSYAPRDHSHAPAAHSAEGHAPRTHTDHAPAAREHTPSREGRQDFAVRPRRDFSSRAEGSPFAQRDNFSAGAPRRPAFMGGSRFGQHRNTTRREASSYSRGPRDTHSSAGSTGGMYMGEAKSKPYDRSRDYGNKGKGPRRGAPTHGKRKRNDF